MTGKANELDRDNSISVVTAEDDTHPSRDAPLLALNVTSVGRRRNHFARVCRTKVPRGRPKLRELEYDSSSENDMVVDTLSSETHKKDWHTTIKVNKHGVKFKIDTGAQCNVLSLRDLSASEPTTSEEITGQIGSILRTANKII